MKTQIAFTITCFLLSGCSHHPSPEHTTSKKVDETTVELSSDGQIKVVSIEQTLYPEIVEIPGKVSIPDKNIVNITARVQGRIESIPLTIGDRISAGQSLGMLWSSDLINAVEELKMAESQHDRQLIQLSEHKLEAMGLHRDDAQPGRGAYPIRARISGVILDKKVNAGSAVSPGDLIVTMGKLGFYQFVGELTPEYLTRIKRGMRVQFPDHPRPLSAKVVNVNPMADPNTNLVKVRCDFERPDQLDLPQETYLRAEIVLSEKPSLVAPSKSLVVTSSGNTVFVKDEVHPGQFKRVPVEIISRNKTLMSLAPSEVIKPGAKVVSDGAILLQGVLEQDQ